MLKFFKKIWTAIKRFFKQERTDEKGGLIEFRPFSYNATDSEIIDYIEKTKDENIRNQLIDFGVTPLSVTLKKDSTELNLYRARIEKFFIDNPVFKVISFIENEIKELKYLTWNIEF